MKKSTIRYSLIIFFSLLSYGTGKTIGGNLGSVLSLIGVCGTIHGIYKIIKSNKKE
jgi:hypothetical protein